MSKNINVFREFAHYVTQSLAAAELPADTRFTIEPPRDMAHGDWTTNIAMVLAKPLGLAPRAVAEKLLPHLKGRNQIARVEIAGPGFINVTMAPDFWPAQVADILTAADKFGKSEIGGGVGVNVEYVSANPTGPMHTGHARNACFGDALANVFVAAGFKVTREFYVNDAGNQMDVLARSTHLRYREALGEDIGAMPEGQYPGEYLKEVAQALVARDGGKWLGQPENEWLDTFKAFAADFLLESIKQDLAQLNIRMDVFTSERAIRQSGKVEQTYDLLKSRDLIYRGVLEKPKGKEIEDWEPVELDLFRATAFGDTSDRAVKRSDGSYTYIMPDIAYHLDKYQRAGPIMVTVVGPHGAWPRTIKAAVAAVTDGQAQFNVRQYDLVRTFDNGVPVKMSKRAGTFLTLADMVERVGKDVVRFVMLTRRPEEVIDFDFTKVTEQSKDNPVFYVQYAHARARSVLRKAAELMPDMNVARADLTLLDDPAEHELIKLLGQYPRMVEAAAVAQEPHRIAYYVQEVAAGFHSLWNKGNDNATLRFVIEGNEPLTTARMALVKATAQVVGSALRLMGVEPVEEMR